MSMVQTLPCSEEDGSTLAAGVMGRTTREGFSAQKEHDYPGLQGQAAERLSEPRRWKQNYSSAPGG